MDTHLTLPTTTLPTTTLPPTTLRTATLRTATVPPVQSPAPPAPAAPVAPAVRPGRRTDPPAPAGAGAEVDPAALLLRVADHGLGVAEPYLTGLLERAAAAGAGPGVRAALADASLPEVVRTRALARIVALLDAPRR